MCHITAIFGVTDYSSQDSLSGLSPSLSFVPSFKHSMATSVAFFNV